MSTEQQSNESINVLLSNRQQFLSFLEKRIGSQEQAEEILQSSLMKGLERVDSLRDEEKVMAWFYRLLRNAVIDHYRSQSTKSKALERLAHELDEPMEQEEMKKLVCTCIDTLIPTLKPEYKEILSAVELQEKSLRDFAEEANISVNNATVRLHRARQSLKQQISRTCGACSTHSCLDCTCHDPSSAH